MFAPLLVGAAISGAAAAGSLVQHYRQQLGPLTLAEVRALRSLPVTPIAEAREGFVKIVGVIGCEHPIDGLFGQVPLAVREAHFYGYEGSGVKARRVLHRVERSDRSFWIEDETGRVTLDPSRCRIDFESEGADGESMAEEHRLRLGERVALLGVVKQGMALARHPLRRSQVEVSGTRLEFEGEPVVTWRTEPEVQPRLLPSVGGVALGASTVGMAVLGALLRV